MSDTPEQLHRRPKWRDYRTAGGARPIKKFIDALSDEHAAAVADSMRDVRDRGLAAARHLQDEIWEVRVDVGQVIYRILFAPQGRKSQILLSLDAFKKKTQKTPPARIQLAKRRLRDWQERGKQSRAKVKPGARAQGRPDRSRRKD